MPAISFANCMAYLLGVWCVSDFDQLALFSGEINVSAAMLSEIDKLVQLLESPVFVCKYQRM